MSIFDTREQLKEEHKVQPSDFMNMQPPVADYNTCSTDRIWMTDTNKITSIKELRSATNLTLKAAKDFTEWPGGVLVPSSLAKALVATGAWGYSPCIALLPKPAKL